MPSAIPGNDSPFPIEVVTRSGGLKVSVTVDLDTRGDAHLSQERVPELDTGLSNSRVRLGGGRHLPNLLFVTNEQRLTDHIGTDEAQLVIALVQEAGQRLLLVSGDDSKPIAAKIHESVNNATAGVVLIGGYGIVPGIRVDSLPQQAVDAGVPRRADLDHFVVWSDDPYVDTDGDGLPELPISRVPDAHSSLVCIRQLCAGPFSVASRGGVRNVARPFAALLVGGEPNDSPLVVSSPNDTSNFEPGWVTSPLTYLMLHGMDIDGTRLWGEDDSGRPLEVLNIASLPDELSGTFFSGCCWGALTTSKTAHQATPGKPVADRVEAQSFALTALARGAVAFVGCTGTHYSPRGERTDRYGGPFHAAFFKAIAQDPQPASATFRAKQDYMGYVASITDATELAYAMKIMNQFTCLGLGW